MNVIRDFQNYTDLTPKALSLGMFDGVHRGHISIIDHLKSVAESRKYQSAILTFWPHPRLVFNPHEELKLLNTLEEKTLLLEQAGIDTLLLKEFDDSFRNLSGEAFIREVLVEQLHVKYLVIGHDHVFGKDKSGNFQLLQQLSAELGYEVKQVEAVKEKEVNISSTKIRNSLATGDIMAANHMLGYAYSLTGKVVDGKKIGRTIGYPTANIEVDALKLLPKKGAYIVEVSLKGQFYKGMLSIGTNPTVNGSQLTAEVYILDFDADIYGETITVKFRDFLHEEIKFESLEQLIARLDEDKRLTEAFGF